MTKALEVGGLQNFNRLLKSIEKKGKKETDKILAKAAIDTQKEAILLIQSGGRSGEVYKRGSKTHQASSAGEAPKTDTENLVKNIIAEKRGHLDYVAGSNKNAPYGVNLEFGTIHMSKRPWLRPSFLKIIKKIKVKYGR